MSDKIQYKSTGAIHKDEGKDYGTLINDDTKFKPHKNVEDIEHTIKIVHEMYLSGEISRKKYLDIVVELNRRKNEIEKNLAQKSIQALSNENKTFKLKKEEIQFEIREIEESIKLINQKTSIPTEQSITKIGQLQVKKSVLKAEYEKLLKEELEKIKVYQTQIKEAKEPVNLDTQNSTPDFISQAAYICQFCFKSFEHNPSKCSKCGLILCEEHAHNHSCIKYYQIEEQHRYEIVGTYPPRKTFFDDIKIPFKNLMHKIGFS